MTTLTEIAVHDLGDRGPIALLQREEEAAREIINAGRKQFTSPVITAMDWASRAWARRVNAPYLEEVEAASEMALPRGLWFMNYAFEWGCTTRATDDPAGGVRLLRTLDWPFHGLGRHLAVARHETALGPYYNITWPGFLGVITAVAPGRFAIAINQAPVLKLGPNWLPYPWYLDWVMGRIGTFAGQNVAPAFLLRQVFESCATFDEAKDLLRTTPLALPVFFVLAGCQAGEHCVIERLPKAANLYDRKAVVANNWLAEELRGYARGLENDKRCEALNSHPLAEDRNMAWLKPPVLNDHTRLALVANAASGQLIVQGFEKDGPATQILEVNCE